MKIARLLKRCTLGVEQHERGARGFGTNQRKVLLGRGGRKNKMVGGGYVYEQQKAKSSFNRTDQKEKTYGGQEAGRYHRLATMKRIGEGKSGPLEGYQSNCWETR